MPNAKDISTPPRNTLIYGPTGSGKTTAFTTIPGKKFAYVFDPSSPVSLAGCDIDYELFLPDTNLGLRRTQKGPRDTRAPKPKEPMSYAKFEDHLEEWLDRDLEGYDVIGFLSVTTLGMMVLERILYINGRWGTNPEIADYGSLGETLLAIFKEVIGKGPMIFIEGHSDLVQDEVSKKVQNQFDTGKAVRRILPRLMSDVWVSSAIQSGDKASYVIQTAPSKEFPAAKNSLQLKYFEDVTIDLKKPREGQGIGRFLK